MLPTFAKGMQARYLINSPQKLIWSSKSLGSAHFPESYPAMKHGCTNGLRHISIAAASPNCVARPQHAICGFKIQRNHFLKTKIHGNTRLVNSIIMARRLHRLATLIMPLVASAAPYSGQTGASKVTIFSDNWLKFIATKSILTWPCFD